MIATEMIPQGDCTNAIFLVISSVIMEDQCTLSFETRRYEYWIVSKIFNFFFYFFFAYSWL